MHSCLVRRKAHQVGRRPGSADRGNRTGLTAASGLSAGPAGRRDRKASEEEPRLPTEHQSVHNVQTGCRVGWIENLGSAWHEKQAGWKAIAGIVAEEQGAGLGLALVLESALAAELPLEAEPGERQEARMRGVAQQVSAGVAEFGSLPLPSPRLHQDQQSLPILNCRIGLLLGLQRGCQA